MRKKILQEIHPLNLIREVEKWPVLYEKDGPERTNMHLKNKMWLEVSKVLFEDWDSYTKPVKELKVQELTRKWRNLRDTFKRHVEMEKRNREGGGGGAAGEGGSGKRKKYVYFKYMLFLLPHLAPADDPPDEPLPELDRYLAAASARAPSRTPSARTTAARTPARTRTHKRRLSPAPAALPAPATPLTPTTRDEDTIDEDKHFLLSLVPTFKRMTDDEKLTAKMEILRVLREVRGGRGEAPAVDVLAVERVKPEFLDVPAPSDHSADSDHDFE